MNITLIALSTVVTLPVAAALVVVSHMVDRTRYAFSDGSFNETAAKFQRAS